MERSVPFGPYTELDEIYVRHAMSADKVSCARDTELHRVAEIMSREGTHSVLVEPEEGKTRGEDWGVISDRDLVAAYFKPHAPAWSVTSTPSATINENARLLRALRQMSENDTAHLIVVDAHEKAIGVLSTVDLIDVMGDLSEADSDAE